MIGGVFTVFAGVAFLMFRMVKKAAAADAAAEEAGSDLVG